MNKHKITAAIFGAVFLGVTLSGGAAFGQGADISKNKRKSGLTKAQREAAEKRAKELEARLNVDKTKEKSELAESGPTKAEGTLDGADAQSAKTMTPEQIEELRRAIEQKNRDQIQKLNKLIDGDPYAKTRDAWMFQKAELLWELRNWEYLRERADYNKCLGAADAGDIDESKCVEPTPNYSEAYSVYEQVLQQYPKYDRLDEVLYRLAVGYIKSGQGAKGVTMLTQLVKNYPNSRYKPEAHLAIAEQYFEKNLFTIAKTNYDEVLKFSDYSFYDYALYKLAWTHYNMQEYRVAIDTFKKVVEQKDDTLGFQKQAINDLVVAFAAVEDGWKEARTYFLEKRDKEFTYKKIGQMAGYLENKGEDDAAVEIYEWFITERPNHERIPQWMESIVIAKKKDVNDLEGLEVAMNRFVAYLDPAGTWATTNKGNDKAIGNADLLVESSLAYLSQFYHQRAQKYDEDNKQADAVPDYKKAAKYYKQFVDRFPNNANSFDMTFFLGDIYLLSLKNEGDGDESLQLAAQYYQKVIDLYNNKNLPKGVKEKDAQVFVKDAAFGVVQAYNELVKKNAPESILVKMAERTGTFKTKDKLKLGEGEENTRPVKRDEKMLAFEEGFVRASDQWATMYPKDDVTPTIDYVAAEVYKSHDWFAEAVPRYESIITNAPKHEYASFAGASLLECNYRLKNWTEVEKWARVLLKNKNYAVISKDALQGNVVFAINEQARELQEAGKVDAGAKQLLRLVEEFPKNEKASGALFNAASLYNGDEQVKRAIEIFERVVKEYPDSDEAPKALYVMGQTFNVRADFERAASYWERLGTKAYREYENSDEAVFDAGVLYRQLGKFDKSIEVSESFIEIYGKTDDKENKELARKLRLELAYIEIDRNEPDKALKRFAEFLKRKDTKPNEAIQAHAEIGELHTKIKRKKWESLSDASFTKSYKAFIKYKGTLDEAGQKTVEYRTARNYASRARFTQAERIYAEFVDVKLEFPIKTLIKKLKEKGELEQEAEKIYFEILDHKDPYYVAASAYRIGQMYKDFSDELYELPMPEGLTPDQEDAYRGQIDEYAFPLQEKALTAFQRARTLALDLQAYNEWSAKSAAEISKLEAAAYPITEQDGVNTEHSQLSFTRSPASVAPEDVRQRLKDRKAEADRIREEEERKRREAEEAARKAAEEAKAAEGKE